MERPRPGLYVSLPFDRGFPHFVTLYGEGGIADRRVVISRETAEALHARGMSFDTGDGPLAPTAPGSIDLSGLKLSRLARALLEGAE